MELLHKELTRQIRACIFEMRKEIGAGFDEETYHQGLILSFLRHNVPFISKEKRSLVHRDTLIRKFVNDFFLFDKIILSLIRSFWPSRPCRRALTKLTWPICKATSKPSN